MMNEPVNIVKALARAARGPAIAVLSSASMCGCGFQLASSSSLPNVMATTYVQTTEPNSEFFESLRDTLRSRGLEVVGTPEQAGARLIISEDNTGQRVLSVSARNAPREYEIFYTVTFALRAGDTELIESEQLVVTRSYTYDETQVLGKAREESILRRSLAEDLARRVVRRIEALVDADATPVG
jgi:LPS-assembly lipoprotein